MNWNHTMGWIYMHSLDGHCGLRQYLDAQLSFEQPGGRNHVLRSALVRMRVYYAAVEHVSIDGTRQVWAAVCPVSYNRRARDGFIFGYKCMTEDMGPCEAECPKQIIDLLTPTESSIANEWRERCRKSLAFKGEIAKKPKLKLGQLVEFDVPIHMTDKTEHKTLEVATSPLCPRQLIFRAPDTGAIYRVRNVRQLAYKVINQSA
jgi:hypothetical protein